MSESTQDNPTIPPDSTVAVTGATGFVGRNVVCTLLAAGYRVRALVRSVERARAVLPAGNLDLIEGEVFDSTALRELLAGASATIHLIGIIEERPRRGVIFERLHTQATRHIVEATLVAGIERYLHMSALGTRAQAPSVYHRTKYAAERIVRSSDLAWTIFRPSLIVGPEGEFARMMQAWARGKAPPYLFLPYFGAGLLGLGRRSRVQPIAVTDVANCFVAALDRPAAIGKVYDLGGPEAFTWPAMLRRVRDLTPGAGRWRPPLPMPAWLALLLAGSAARLGVPGLLPFNAAQVRMSQEDSICNPSPAFWELDLALTPLAAALAGGGQAA
jgi:uncharacterized protein YbjT (DUF2867 family)